MQASMRFWLFLPTILCAAGDTWTEPPREHRCLSPVVCPNWMHTACNSTYFIRAAAVRTKRKKYVIWNAARVCALVDSLTWPESV